MFQILFFYIDSHNNITNTVHCSLFTVHYSLFEKLGLISECHLSKDIYEIAKQINDSGHDMKVFEACLNCIGKMDFQGAYDGVMNCYMSEYSDDETFAQYILEDDIPESFPNYIYIDWESTARNLMYDYFESDGYYFRS